MDTSHTRLDKNYGHAQGATGAQSPHPLKRERKKN